MATRSRSTVRRFFVDNEIIDDYERAVGSIGQHLYIAIVRHCDLDSQTTFISQAGLGRKTGYHRSTVNQYMQKLEKAGLISRQPRFRADGGRTSDLITVLEVPPVVLDDTPCRPEQLTPVVQADSNNPHYNNPQDTKQLSKAKLPLEPIEITEVHYQEPGVSARGRVRDGPWNYKCPGCGTTVFFKVAGHTRECMSCGAMYILRLQKPGAKIKPRKSEAVEAYYSVMKGRVRYGSLDEIWEAQISDAVSNAQFWKEVLVAWLAQRKWNPTNISGLLDYYERGKLPGTRQKKQPVADLRDAITDDQLLGPTVPYWELEDDEVDSGALDPNTGFGILIPAPKEDAHGRTEGAGDESRREDQVAEGEKVAADPSL